MNEWRIARSLRVLETSWTPSEGNRNLLTVLRLAASGRFVRYVLDARHLIVTRHGFQGTRPPVSAFSAENEEGDHSCEKASRRLQRPGHSLASAVQFALFTGPRCEKGDAAAYNGGHEPRHGRGRFSLFPDKALVRGPSSLRVCDPPFGYYAAYIRPPSAVEPKLAFVRRPTNGVEPLYASPPEINA